MELLMQIWAALVALFQALAVISLYLVVMHLLTTVSEYFGRRNATYHTEVSDEDADDDDLNRGFFFEILDARQVWFLKQRVEHTRLVVRWRIEHRWGPICLWTNHPSFSHADFERLPADWKTWEMPADLVEETAEEFPDHSPEERSDMTFLSAWFQDRYPIDQAEDYRHRYELIEEFQIKYHEVLLATPEHILQLGGNNPAEPRDRLSPEFLEFILGGFVEPWFRGRVGRHLLLESRSKFAYDHTLAAFRTWLVNQRGKYSN